MEADEKEWNASRYPSGVGALCCALDLAAQSEIGDLATTISVQEDVGRLQKYESFVEEATVFYLSKEEQRTGVNTF